MKTRAIASGCAGLMLLLVSAAPRGESLKSPREAGSGSPAPAGVTVAADINAETSAVVGRYCVRCHNEKAKAGGLTLDAAGMTTVSAHPEVWEKAVRKVRAGLMPPQTAPKPDPAVLTNWVAGLEKTLDVAATAQPNPGRVPAIHRLNRTEYPNVIRDLLALDVDSSAMLPVEDAGYGFDNIADVLSVSPSLIERYVLAASKVSKLAMGTQLSRPIAVAYMNSPLLWQEDRLSDDLPLGSRGGIAVRHTFPNDGEYQINVIIPVGADYSQHVRDLEGTEPLEVRLDYERVRLIQPKAKGMKGAENPDVDRYDNRGPSKDSPLSFKLPVKAGPHLVGISFVSDLSHRLPNDSRPPRPNLKSFFFQQYAHDPQVLGVQIVGPFNGKEASDTPSRRRILVCQPTTGAQEEPCARKILTTLAHRAYRGTETAADVQKLVAAYTQGRASSGDFEMGIEWALETLLVQPGVLFRVERDPATARPGVPYHISDLELASRLSFFLWSSIPDDELLAVAKRGKLSDPIVLQQQVRRMLGDPKSVALAKNFAGQWLWLRKLQHVQPDPYLYPSFNDNLKQAMQQETELFFDSQVREDHGVSELLTANYTFLNEVLAKHYGILDVYGDHFRRVTLTDERRFGLLGQGSILTVSSYANRTSPVIRGKWLLENFLGTPPPPPPPNVPSLKENGEGAAPTTVRARLEQHRKNPVCASCHRNMDPLGFALENFDATGSWRTVDAESKEPIDASGAFSDGAKFDGVVAFRKELVAQRQVQFTDTVVEKLLTYATGRGMEYYDRPAIRQILRDGAANDYRWSSIILGIVKSKPFQMRIEPADPAQLRAENTESPTRRP